MHLVCTCILFLCLALPLASPAAAAPPLPPLLPPHPFPHTSLPPPPPRRVMALCNLAASPFLLAFLAIYFFMKNAEQFYHHPSSVGEWVARPVGWVAGWLAGLADREHAPPSLHPAPPTRKLPLHAAGARRWSPLAKWRLRWAGLWLALRSLWPQAECQAVPCKSRRPAAHSFSIALPNWQPCVLIPCREFNELPHFISHRQAAQQLRQGRGALTSHSQDHSDAKPWLPGACYNVHMLHCVLLCCRLNASHKAAEEYIQQFPNPVLRWGGGCGGARRQAGGQL